MAKCPACGAEVGCLCNLKTASDGSKRCGACLYNYEQSLINVRPNNVLVEPPLQNNEVKTYTVAPVINSVTAQYNNYNT